MWHQNICSVSFSFVTIHTCDRRTDRRKDGQTNRRTELPLPRPPSHMFAVIKLAIIGRMPLQPLPISRLTVMKCRLSHRVAILELLHHKILNQQFYAVLCRSRDFYILVRAFNMCVLPLLEYNSIVWSPRGKILNALNESYRWIY